MEKASSVSVTGHARSCTHNSSNVSCGLGQRRITVKGALITHMHGNELMAVMLVEFGESDFQQANLTAHCP